MAKVKEFCALIYNQQKVKEPAKVFCPPYDVISPQAQDYYHNLCPYNFIHILLGKDIPGEDKYKKAANYFKDWQKDNVFVKEGAAAVYFYSQEYFLRGEKKTRFGFIALLKLGEKDSPVHAHENTRLKPKEDRLKLLRQVRANLSPIFIVFRDKRRIIQGLLQQCAQKSEPFIQASDNEKTTHRLWRIDDPGIIRKVKEAMALEDVFIADGHHRYEVACTYRDELRQRLGREEQDEKFSYILSYFTNTDPRGLSILPIHRLLKLEKAPCPDTFRQSLKGYFDLEQVKDRTRFFFLLEKAGLREHLIGMYRDKKYWLLRLKNIKILDKEMQDKPAVYRRLDVSILSQLVFKKILGLDTDGKDRECLVYTPHPEEVIGQVDSCGNYIGFFLNPVKIDDIISLALKGEKMPPKSTYFFPKVLSGLVINKLED